MYYLYFIVFKKDETPPCISHPRQNRSALPLENGAANVPLRSRRRERPLQEQAGGLAQLRLEQRVRPGQLHTGVRQPVPRVKRLPGVLVRRQGGRLCHEVLGGVGPGRVHLGC